MIDLTLAPPLVDLKRHVDSLHSLLNKPLDTSTWRASVQAGMEHIAAMARPAVPRAPIKRCSECDEPVFGRGELCAVCRTAEGEYEEADAQLTAVYEGD